MLIKQDQNTQPLWKGVSSPSLPPGAARLSRGQKNLVPVRIRTEATPHPRSSKYGFVLMRALHRQACHSQKALKNS